MTTTRPIRKTRRNRYLEGQLLVAMPSMTDKRFQRSVIYMCAHSEAGAMGLIINQKASELRFPKLLQQLNLMRKQSEDDLPENVRDMDVHVGGPVETSRGFVLHSADYRATDSTLLIGRTFRLTATIDILKAIAAGKGPNRALLALGYSGWAAGQLENEIQANGWLTCPADADLVFDRDHDAKYERAMSKIGINLLHLSSNAGHA